MITLIFFLHSICFHQFHVYSLPLTERPLKQPSVSPLFKAQNSNIDEEASLATNTVTGLTHGGHQKVEQEHKVQGTKKSYSEEYAVTSEYIVNKNIGPQSSTVLKPQKRKSLFQFMPEPKVHKSYSSTNTVDFDQNSKARTKTEAEKEFRKEVVSGLPASDQNSKNAKAKPSTDKNFHREKEQGSTLKSEYEKRVLEKVVPKSKAKEVDLKDSTSKPDIDPGSADTVALKTIKVEDDKPATRFIPKTGQPEMLAEKQPQTEEDSELQVNQNTDDVLTAGNLDDSNVAAGKGVNEIMVPSELDSSEIRFQSSAGGEAKQLVPLPPKVTEPQYEKPKNGIVETFFNSLKITAKCLHGSCNHVFKQGSEQEVSSIRVMKPPERSEMALPPRHRRKQRTQNS